MPEANTTKVISSTLGTRERLNPTATAAAMKAAVRESRSIGVMDWKGGPGGRSSANRITKYAAWRGKPSTGNRRRRLPVREERMVGPAGAGLQV
jgi:hypothetical protein